MLKITHVSLKGPSYLWKMNRSSNMNSGPPQRSGTEKLYGSFTREEFFMAKAGSVTRLCLLEQNLCQLSLLPRFAQEGSADHFPEDWRLQLAHTRKEECSTTSSVLLPCPPEGQAPTPGSTVELCSVDLKARIQSTQSPRQKGTTRGYVIKVLEFVDHSCRTNYHKFSSSKHHTFIIS